MQQWSLVRGKSPQMRHGAKPQTLAHDSHSISLKKNPTALRKPMGWEDNLEVPLPEKRCCHPDTLR